MSKTFCFCVLLSIFAYQCKPRMHYSGRGKLIDTVHVVVEGTSMYDTLVPARLNTDSTKLYKKLTELLEFSRDLKYENEDRVASYYFIVGDDGQIQQTKIQNGIQASKDIQADMVKVMDYVLMNLTEWEPAFLKANPSKKISYLVEVVFYFYRERIQFKVQGPESYYFLKKAYKPNYSKVD